MVVKEFVIWLYLLYTQIFTFWAEFPLFYANVDDANFKGKQLNYVFFYIISGWNRLNMHVINKTVRFKYIQSRIM